MAWWRHVDNDPTISVASRACFLLLAQTGGCAVAGPNIGTVTSYKVPVLPITPSPASQPGSHTISSLNIITPQPRLQYRRILQGEGACRCILQIVVLRRPSSCPDVACSLVSTYDFARLCSATYFRNSSSAFIPSFPELQACTSSACSMNTLAQDSRDSLKQPHSLNICWYPGQVEFKILLGHSPL